MARSEALNRAEKMYLDGFPDPETATVEDLRAAYDNLFLQFTLPSSTEVSERELGGVPVRVIRADGASADKVLVWCHGGGNIMGSAHGFQDLGNSFSAASGVTTVMVDFRKAPENPFPAANDDAVAAIRAAVAQYGAENVAVGGDSAGGGLTLSALAQLRDRDETQPAAAVFVSALLDLTANGGGSMNEFNGIDIAVSQGSIGNITAAYLQGADPADPIGSPLFAELHDLPPALFLVGSKEVLRDDARRAAAKIVEAGGLATVSEYDDMCHVWPLFAQILPEGRDAAEEIGAFVAKGLTH
ncbi:alpha/beta hydrolase [Arthrobacter sp. 08Y14]|uniref:alpha/beta hydrolase n=1 Tax=Arthrobacter sp. 08Y14 TaxID=2058885 RepID=UPI000CE2E103|nr:alpha/beta hydrolase [Arthrobacter sp. 08Y14]